VHLTLAKLRTGGMMSLRQAFWHERILAEAKQ
jgi:hypothetical protein